ncbi:MAG TPA: cyclopropane-fatty-acyl-phospholipid synthase family protein [Jiangellales bacterium]|nr:cyclopropane-fatty-acyl-phospholipid synthase family protein [Jiangellales bacterium]
MTVAEAIERLFGGEAPVRFEAYDGTTTGPSGASDTGPVIEVRSPDALSYVATAPGSLGMARAYVTGAMEVRGDLHEALSLIMSHVDRIRLRDLGEIVRGLGIGVLRRPPLPAQERRVSGLRHSRSRDAQAISHHYDVSNRFYEMVLGPSMAYTCAVYPRLDATLEEAQATKFELVARKLGLREGMRLLDVGCGWGGMAMHAAREHGVQVLGVTLSRAQAEWARDAVAEAGLDKLVEIRHGDYRDVRESGFDAVSSIGLTEHVGLHQLPRYATHLRDRLRPGGRLLNHCITRPTTRARARAGAFITRYVFPDGELLGVGRIVSALQDNGFEIRHSENLREHYAMTLQDWGANLERNWDDAVAEAGLATSRVWRLYMAGSRVGFDRHGIELQQVLAVKIPRGGESGMPLRPDWGS